MQYEPELFPGLIYRMRSPNIVLLIFVSGKVVITGGKARPPLRTQQPAPCLRMPCCLHVCSSLLTWHARCLQRREDVYEAFENIYPVLTEFRKVERAALPLPLGGPSGAGGSAAP